MAYSNLADSGVLATTSGAALTWTHSPTTNNLLTARATSWDAVVGTSTLGASAATSVGGSGTFNRTDDQADVDGDSKEHACLYYLLSPASVTSMKLTPPSAHPTNAECVFNEWSGNDTSSPLDVHNTGHALSGSMNTGSINTGANAGLALGVINTDDGNASAATHTGTFTADYNTGDGAPNSLTTLFSWKTSSIASQSGLQDTCTNTSCNWCGVIASFNVPAAGGPVIQMMTVADQSMVGSAI